jgi:predicted metal-dependent phosphoesterase TrpH
LDSSRDAEIDLHIHSSASDGTFTPTEILSTAVMLNLKAIAITDHDTIQGSREALAAGIPTNLEFITGVEISAAPPPGFNLTGSIHILGYSIDLDNHRLIKTLEVLRKSRENRNPKILGRLNQLGIQVSPEDLQREAGDAMVGRPHIAAAMVTKGYAVSIDDAFDRLLGKGKPAYVDKYRIPSEEAVHVILEAGGVPVLAHPLLTGLENSRLEALLLRLKEMGMMGIEAYYPEHPPDSVALYLALARRHDLLVTGGTDFHGEIKPEIQMGFGAGDFGVTYELIPKLRSAGT